MMTYFNKKSKWTAAAAIRRVWKILAGFLLWGHTAVMEAQPNKAQQGPDEAQKLLEGARDDARRAYEEASEKAKSNPQCLTFGLLWFLLLILLGFPLAGLSAGLYILLVPFTACFRSVTVSCCPSWPCIGKCPSWPQGWKCGPSCHLYLQTLTDLLLKGVDLTYWCADNMMSGTSFKEAFFGTDGWILLLLLCNLFFFPMNLVHHLLNRGFFS